MPVRGGLEFHVDAPTIVSVLLLIGRPTPCSQGGVHIPNTGPESYARVFLFQTYNYHHHTVVYAGVVIKGLYQAAETCRCAIYRHLCHYIMVLSWLTDKRMREKRASAGQKPSKSYFSFSQTMQISCKPVDVDAPAPASLMKKPDDNKCKR